ncbi:hypothetical protein [Leptospira sp. Pond_2020]|uniref:hypothetical protein n=1 Tax=Leptospira sp. Pond_2020 TaxID=2846916 RepID=UPI001E308B60|nr:hypothetical protein [Leptospira sp. Pond_2020]
MTSYEYMGSYGGIRVRRADLEESEAYRFLHFLPTTDTWDEKERKTITGLK